MDRKELQRALAEVAPTAGTAVNTTGRSAFSDLIVETIEPNHVGLEVFNAFLNTRELNVGDSLVKKLRRAPGYPVRTMVPGTEHLSDVLYPGVQSMTYALDTLITKMRMNLWELRRGEMGTIEQFRSEMQLALVDAIVARVSSLIGQTWDGTVSRTNFVDATATGLTIDILDTMIETVIYRAGNVKAIVGPRAALLPIYKNNGVVEYAPHSPNTNGIIGLPDILMEWKNTGRLASFRGIPLIELPQIYQRSSNNYDKPLIDQSRVVVVGDNAGEVVLYGGVETQESTDLTTEPGDYVLAMWRSYGLILDQIENVGVIKVTPPDLQHLTYSVNYPSSTSPNNAW